MVVDSPCKCPSYFDFLKKTSILCLCCNLVASLYTPTEFETFLTLPMSSRLSTVAKVNSEKEPIITCVAGLSGVHRTTCCIFFKLMQ